MTREVLERSGISQNDRTDTLCNYSIDSVETRLVASNAIVTQGIDETLTVSGHVWDWCTEKSINRNKPWRELIKRRTNSGGADNENPS